MPALTLTPADEVTGALPTAGVDSGNPQLGVRTAPDAPDILHHWADGAVFPSSTNRPGDVGRGDRPPGVE